MEIIRFPFERVIEINTMILSLGRGYRGQIDIAKLQGALGRIDNAILYHNLNDIFEIAAKYATSIAVAHSLPDANKRTGLAVALEFLSFNDYELTADNTLFADAVADLVTGELLEQEFADLLYAQYLKETTK